MSDNDNEDNGMIRMIRSRGSGDSVTGQGEKMAIGSEVVRAWKEER